MSDLSPRAAADNLERCFVTRAWTVLFGELDTAGIELRGCDVDAAEFGITAGFAALVALLAECDLDGRLMLALASAANRRATI